MLVFYIISYNIMLLLVYKIVCSTDPIYVFKP